MGQQREASGLWRVLRGAPVMEVGVGVRFCRQQGFPSLRGFSASRALRGRAARQLFGVLLVAVKVWGGTAPHLKARGNRASCEGKCFSLP